MTSTAALEGVRTLARRVLGAVVDDDHEIPGVVERSQDLERVADYELLVVGRHDESHGRA